MLNANTCKMAKDRPTNFKSDMTSKNVFQKGRGQDHVTP